MESYLVSDLFDLVTPDGKITSIKNGKAEVFIENISPAFVGFQIDLSSIFFNFKSTLAQVGLHAQTEQIELDPKLRTARVRLTIEALGAIAKQMLPLLTPGAYIGKLFAADERRRVRNPDYLARMFGRSDAKARPLLSLGALKATTNFSSKKSMAALWQHLSS